MSQSGLIEENLFYKFQMEPLSLKKVEGKTYCTVPIVLTPKNKFGSVWVVTKSSQIRNQFCGSEFNWFSESGCGSRKAKMVPASCTHTIN